MSNGYKWKSPRERCIGLVHIEKRKGGRKERRLYVKGMKINAYKSDYK